MAHLVLSRYRSDIDPKKPRDGYVSGHLTVCRDGENLADPTHIFPTIERSGTPWLRMGTYRVKMDHKNTKRIVGRKKSGDPIFADVRCFRPLDCPFSSILIHDASGDNHMTLEGCVAPGTLIDYVNGGIYNSRGAMDRIMDEILGPFEVGKEFDLEVVDNWPGAGDGTRETYWPDRAAAFNKKYGASCPLSPPVPVVPDAGPRDPDEVVMPNFGPLGLSPLP